ncbi:MAG: hypothetical protein CMP23_03300 [Rickettsiales bacterium]|nr:hypothetical protein [Rickettsiales bacterium]
MEGTRFCPLHGDYAVDGSETACPSCRADPESSTISLQRVRVLDTGRVDTLATGDSLLTPINEELPCPVCGVEASLSEFRHEALGEEWTREAAEWAEEGVCPSCYRDILPPYIREWSDGEWLSHHYEGWRNTVEAVVEIRRYEDAALETWLPKEERHRLLDIAATLSARREHLALCQSAMEDLLNRYPGSMTPPPFERALVQAREHALAGSALTELKALHQADVALEQERSEQLGDGPGLTMDEVVSREQEENATTVLVGAAAAREEDAGELQRWHIVLVAGAIAGLLLWLLSRV